MAAACGPAVERGPKRWPLCCAGTPNTRSPPSTSSSSGASSSTPRTPLARTQAPAPRGTTTRADDGRRRSEGRCRWSPCRWEISTRSASA